MTAIIRTVMKTMDSKEDMCSVVLKKQYPGCGECLDSGAIPNKKLETSLKPLQKRLQRLEKVKQKLDNVSSRIKDQSRYTVRQIQDQFKKLHQFLLEEEETRLRALREEEELKTQRMKDKMGAVSREIEALSETIRATEEQLRSADVCFLLKYKAAVERVQCCPLVEETQLGPGALIDQAKHLGNLAFNIWTNMKRLVQYTPVILDPNTTNPEAVLSHDLTSFTPKKKQAETEEDITAVLGSEGFDSGSHSWDVEVGHTDWGLGVVTEAVFSDEHDDYEDVEGWGIGLLDGIYVTEELTKKGQTSLKLKSNPRKIRVNLDWDKHKLTFHNADTNTHIHSFTNISHKKLFPIVGTTWKNQIRILPQEPTVHVNCKVSI